jgi:hypothetical protein
LAIIISGNTIHNLGSVEVGAAVRGIVVRVNSRSASVVTISDNHIRGPRTLAPNGTWLTTGIDCHRVAPGGAGKLVAVIHNNTIRTGPIEVNGIRFSGSDRGLTGDCSSVSVCGNYVSTTKIGPSIPNPELGASEIHVFGAGEVRVSNNQLGVIGTASQLPSILINLELSNGHRKTLGNVWLNGNAIRGEKAAGIPVIWVADDNNLFASENGYNGSEVHVKR